MDNVDYRDPTGKQIPHLLQSFFYGDVESTQAAANLVRGLAGTDYRLQSSPADHQSYPDTALWWWRGAIPAHGDRAPVGVYRSLNAARVPAVQAAALAQVQKSHDAGKTYASTEYCYKTRYGLRLPADSYVCLTAGAEIDDAPLEEQAERLGTFEAMTGLQWTDLTLSGDTRPESVARALRLYPGAEVQPGKSAHASLALHPCTAQVWAQVQRAIVGLLWSDPALVDTPRAMRYPGVIGGSLVKGRPDFTKIRVQTCLRTLPTVYTAEAVVEAVTAALQAQWGVTPDDAYRARQEAARASAMAKTARENGDLDGAAELEALALSLQETRTPTNSKSRASSSPKAMGKSSGKSRTSSTALQDTIEIGTPITDRDGVIWRVGDPSIPPEGVQCYDPAETPGESSPSGRLYPWGLYSSHGGVGISYRKAPPVGGTSIFQDVVWGSKPHPKNHQKNQWFKPDPGWEQTPIHIFQVDLGLGKTTWLKTHIQSQLRKNENFRALIVNHRQGLSRSLALDCGGTCYLDCGPEIDPTEHEILVITPNSLGKISPPPGFAYDLIVVEESESTFRHWYGNTMRHRRGKTANGDESGTRRVDLLGGDLFYAFMEFCQKTLEKQQHIICMDAYAGAGTRAFCSTLAKVSGVSAPVTTAQTRQLGWECRVHDSWAALVSDATTRVYEGERVALACTSARDVVSFERFFSTLPRRDGTFPTVVAHHRDQSAEAASSLAAVNTAWAGADVVVYSPTVDCGYSYDRTDVRFDRRYVVAKRPRGGRGGIPGFGALTVLQMSRRVRDEAMETPSLDLWVDPAWAHQQPVTAGEIRTRQLESVKAAQSVRRYVNPDGDWVSGPAAWENFEVWLGTEVEARLQSRNVMDSVTLDLQSKGVEFKTLPPLDPEVAQEIYAEFKALREEIDNDTVARTMGAKPLNDYSFQQLRQREVLGDDDKFSVKRSGHLDLFGSLTSDDVRSDLRGKLRQQIYTHTRYRLLWSGHDAEALDYYTQLVEAGYTAQFDPGGLEFLLLRDVLIAGMGRKIKGLLPDGGLSEKAFKSNTSGSFDDFSFDYQSAPNIGFISNASELTQDQIQKLSAKAGGAEIFDANRILDVWLIRMKNRQFRDAARQAGVDTCWDNDAHRVVRPDNPLTVVKQILRRMGIELELSATRSFKFSAPDGDVTKISRRSVRLYGISQENRAYLLRLSDRHYQRCLGLRVRPIEEIDPRREELFDHEDPTPTWDALDTECQELVGGSVDSPQAPDPAPEPVGFRVQSPPRPPLSDELGFCWDDQYLVCLEPELIQLLN